ncbi:signal peptidase I [Zhihengliuella sp.]|uniref:signal peptidase I n=1 Tax=Zhihengliuella sp. TaxID=1954483 RepID=UPI0028119FC2|nr:signal peptidase I [Zhihengliuella sp.]
MLDSSTAPARGHAKRRSRSRDWRFVVPVLAAAAVIALLLRATVVDFFYIDSASMTPALRPGDGLLVNRLAYAGGAPEAGDVVVFDGTGTLAPYRSPDVVRDLVEGLRLAGGNDYFVKRVVGAPGDHVVCCDADGRLVRNGEPVREPYLHPGDAPSTTAFDVTVPDGRIWVMGDHRSDSTDSRALLGAPGGGVIPVERVVGRVDRIVWPPERGGRLGSDAQGTQQ